MNEARKKALDDIIARNNLAGLIFWKPDELVMTLGYLPNWGLSFFLYTRDRASFLFVPELEPEYILPGEVTLVRFPWGVLDCGDPWEDLFRKLKAVLTGRGMDTLPVSFIPQIGGTAPCRMAGEQPPLPADLVSRLSALSVGGYKDITPELLALYSIKTNEDIAGLERTHRVAELATQTFGELAFAGVTEAALAAAVEAAVQRVTGRDGIEYARAFAMVQSGPNTQFGGRYNLSSGRILQKGELVLLEASICVNGYWADITRTESTSKMSNEQRDIVSLVEDAKNLAISRMKPGVPMRDIDALARGMVEKAGFGNLFNHGLGHHVGFRYHDPGQGLSPSSAGVLQEGMVLTVEPGIYGASLQFGARIEENVLITADGCRVLSAY